MSTRGFVGYKLDGTIYGLFNHYDSYPDSLGVDVLTMIRKCISGNNLDPVKENCRKLNWTNKTTVDENALDINDTSILVEIMAGPSFTTTSGEEAVRNFNFASTLHNAIEFTKDGLFCEWSYIIDLDKGCLEVYKKGLRELYQTIPFDDTTTEIILSRRRA